MYIMNKELYSFEPVKGQMLVYTVCGTVITKWFHKYGAEALFLRLH